MRHGSSKLESDVHVDTVLAQFPGFGEDIGSVDGYALQEADYVYRVFLPALRTDISPRSSVLWADVASDFGRSSRLGPEMTWRGITELPGDGTRSPQRQYREPRGEVDAELRDSIVALFDEVVGQSAWWLQLSSALRVRIPHAHKDHSERFSEGLLRDLAEEWEMGGLPLRLSDSEPTAALAAPEYSNSFIVSGPWQLRTAMRRLQYDWFSIERSVSSRCLVM